MIFSDVREALDYDLWRADPHGFDVRALARPLSWIKGVTWTP